uniref:Meteorin, glial cell differentiation regulator n=1 Tax=Neolamprologus brichardi TaxID=32507 RepID=A0A3Q4I2Q9_NEOBR
MPGFGVWIYAVWILLFSLFHVSLSNYSEDQCSWRGSGLSQQQGSVEQISLHCSEGTLDWLYPKGALRLTLSPRLPSMVVGPSGSSSGLITACVKPSEEFHGAQLYLERDGVLELLVGDRLESSPPPRVRCFSRLPGERVALFLQATPHQDISRRIASFRYELRGDWTASAVCMDFPRPLVRGNIKSVEEDENLRAAVIKVSATRVFRQKYTLFTGNSRLSSRGEIRTLLQCGVKPGPGSFLFTGRVHFGEAWLGCAPRYKDFQRAYTIAKAAQQIPCELPVD